MRNIVITGSSCGIGKATAEYFLTNGFTVYGLDLLESTIDHPNYIHHVCDCADKDSMPDIEDVEYVFINAGSQNTQDDIKNNLYSAIYTAEKYAFQPSVKSVLFNASVSAHNGAEFPFYICSKGGMLPYMKYVASKIAEHGATCNSLSCGGVLTDLNKPVMDDEKLWSAIMDVTPLKKWASAEEIAVWVYFMLVINKSCTGQDIIIDNGELNLASTNNFVWSED